MESRTTSVPSDELNAYIGSGSIDFTTHASGSSSDSGPGNMASYFAVKTGADVKVVYEYVPADVINTNQCEEKQIPASITTKLSKVRSASQVIADRTLKFTKKARACGSRITNVNYSKSLDILKQIETLLTTNYVPTKVVCTNSVCNQQSTERSTTRLRALANRLSTIQIATKLQAILACRTQSSGRDNRKNSGYYREQLLSTIDKLPTKTKLCKLN